MTTPSVPGSTQGDGLIRPLNAPKGQQVLPGVQPGVSGAVVTAQFVIIFGTSGQQAGGLFIYAGSPGPGNAPIYSMSNATEDPYGNPISAGIWAGQFGSIQAGLEFNGTLGQLVFPTPLNVTEFGGLSGQTLGQSSVTQLFSAIAAAPYNDRTVLQMDSNPQTAGASSAFFLFYQDANGNANTHIEGDYAGTALFVVKTLDAVLPGTGTSPTNPAQIEPWHLITLDSGWAVTAGRAQPQYRLMADGNVQFAGSATHAASGTNIALNSGVPLGTAYRPVNPKLYRSNGTTEDTLAEAEYGTNGVITARVSGTAVPELALDGIVSLL